MCWMAAVKAPSPSPKSPSVAGRSREENDPARANARQLLSVAGRTPARCGFPAIGARLCGGRLPFAQTPVTVHEQTLPGLGRAPGPADFHPYGCRVRAEPKDQSAVAAGRETFPALGES